MNNRVIGAANPESCCSLVDAICKTHDWRYKKAEELYGAGTVDCEKAKIDADTHMLQDIAEACLSHTFQETEFGAWGILGGRP